MPLQTAAPRGRTPALSLATAPALATTLALGAALALPLALALPAAACRAEEAPAKRGYHLFRPTPDSLLRDLSTDRPDLTESPYTVDAGRVQVELDLISYARDDDGAVRAESWGVAPINVKFGLTPSADLQVIVETHRRDRLTDRAAGARVEAQGVGDLTLRLKRNLWGNDAGRTALALMPFVKLPLADEPLGNGAVEGGLIVPLAVSLPSDFGLGLMGQVDLLEDADGEGRHAAWTGTGTVGRDVAGPLGAFVEIAATSGAPGEGGPVSTLDVGVTAGLTRDVQLDGGVLLGLSDAADDRAFFLGLSIRR